MNQSEAIRLLNQQLEPYCRLGYDALSARIGDEAFVEVLGKSGTEYQIEIQIFWDDRPGGAIRVFGSIDDGGWRAFFPLVVDFLVHAEEAKAGDKRSPDL